MLRFFRDGTENLRGEAIGLGCTSPLDVGTHP
jgi:hypothetical protein